MRRANVAALAVLLLAACGRPAPDESAKAGNPLEVAARERGVVHPEAASPVGVFERAHDLGRDAMCVVPDGAGKWRFAVTAAFGPGLSCAANGTMVREGGGWRMRFAGADGCEAFRSKKRMSSACPETCRRNAAACAPTAPRSRGSACRARAGRRPTRGACGSPIETAICTVHARAELPRNDPLGRA